MRKGEILEMTKKINIELNIEQFESVDQIKQIFNDIECWSVNGKTYIFDKPTKSRLRVVPGQYVVRLKEGNYIVLNDLNY